MPIHPSEIWDEPVTPAARRARYSELPIDRLEAMLAARIAERDFLAMNLPQWRTEFIELCSKHRRWTPADMERVGEAGDLFEAGSLLNKKNKEDIAVLEELLLSKKQLQQRGECFAHKLIATSLYVFSNRGLPSKHLLIRADEEPPCSSHVLPDAARSWLTFPRVRRRRQQLTVAEQGELLAIVPLVRDIGACRGGCILYAFPLPCHAEATMHRPLLRAEH